MTIRTSPFETIKHPGEGIAVQRNIYKPVTVPDLEVKQYACIKLNVPHWYERQDFMLWLNAHAAPAHGYRSHATWHRDWPGYGEPNEYSDAFILYDNGEGSDFEIMPDEIWAEICRICKVLRVETAIIWLTNLAVVPENGAVYRDGCVHCGSRWERLSANDPPVPTPGGGATQAMQCENCEQVEMYVLTAEEVADLDEVEIQNGD